MLLLKLNLLREKKGIISHYLQILDAKQQMQMEEFFMKATGIVRRIEECVIIGQKLSKLA